MFNSLYLVFAQAEHAVEETAKSHPSLIELIAQSNVINVTIVVLFLGYLVHRYKLFSGIDTQQAKIIEELQNAEKNRELAIKQLNEAQEKLNQAKDEADKIIKEAENIASVMQNEIINKAHKDAEKIVEQARKVIENEKKMVVVELQRNLTTAALEVAKDNIKTSLDDNWQRKLIQDFVDNLDKVKAY